MREKAETGGQTGSLTRIDAGALRQLLKVIGLGGIWTNTAGGALKRRKCGAFIDKKETRG